MTTVIAENNHWSPFLAAHAEEINKLSVGGSYLWSLAADMVEQFHQPGDRVLEIGCGPGDSTVPVISRPCFKGMGEGRFHLVDSSPRAVRACLKALPDERRPLVSIFEEDALEYLKHIQLGVDYGVIYSAWTIHNFAQDYKRAVLMAILERLKPGGTFVLMDKVYPDDKERARSMLDAQLRRYTMRLPAQVAAVICEHEEKDFHRTYRMDEKYFEGYLRSMGFHMISYIDRVERDVVLVARKRD